MPDQTDDALVSYSFDLAFHSIYMKHERWMQDQ